MNGHECIEGGGETHLDVVGSHSQQDEQSQGAADRVGEELERVGEESVGEHQRGSHHREEHSLAEVGDVGEEEPGVSSSHQEIVGNRAAHLVFLVLLGEAWELEICGLEGVLGFGLCWLSGRCLGTWWKSR